MVDNKLISVRAIDLHLWLAGKIKKTEVCEKSVLNISVASHLLYKLLMYSYFFFQALSVGIFPYVLKLLQSSARELRPLLVFIWAKILAVDSVSDSFTHMSMKQSVYLFESRLTLTVFKCTVILLVKERGCERKVSCLRAKHNVVD